MDYDFKPLTQDALNYLVNVRSISKETLEVYRVACNYRGEIVVPFYDENDILWLVKNRSATGGMLQRSRVEEDGTVTHYEVKTDSAQGGKPVLLGSHIPNNTTHLYICYGDYDCMSLYECGVKGAVSMPFGDRGINWIDRQWDWIQTFQKIVFCPDFDGDAKVLSHLMNKLQELSKRIGKHKCYLTQEKWMLGCKDVNDLYVTAGKQAIIDLLNNVVPVPEVGLARLVDYHDSIAKEGTPVGIPEIDKATGGHAGGQLSLIGGDNNAGKTTLMLNQLKEFVNAGEICFYWSGEQKPDKVRWWWEQILAGPDHVVSQVSKNTGREYWYCNPEFVTKIRKWYADRLFVYDKRGVSPAEFFEVIELAVRRYNVTKIFIDNLMAFTGGEENYFQAQGDFAESCKNFAEDWDVHVTLIVHNKKLERGLIPDKDSIEGSKKVTNWADLVYQLLRINDANRKPEWAEANSILSLCKNRETEHLVDVRLLFDPKSKRLVQFSCPLDIQKRLGWQGEEEFNLDF